MPTRIHFVRHGKPHNPKNIFYGRLPRIRLSEEGKVQAKETGKKLKSIKPAAIYASPMLRTRQTAKEISNELGLKVSHSRHIIEVYSHFQGQTIEYMRTFNWNTYTPDVRIGDDESMEDVVNRLIKFCQKMEAKHPNQDVVAVSHGDPIMLVRAIANKLPIEISSLRPDPKDYIGYAQILSIEVNEGNLTSFSK